MGASVMEKDYFILWNCPANWKEKTVITDNDDRLFSTQPSFQRRLKYQHLISRFMGTGKFDIESPA